MVSIGEQVGRETIAVITDMDEPLGAAVGNALEVREAVETLRGRGSKDLEELCLDLGGYMLMLGRKAESIEQGRIVLKKLIESGDAFEKLKQIVKAQGGNPDVIEHPEKLPAARRILTVESADEGYVSRIAAESIGAAAMMLGAGRATKDAEIDLP